MSNKSHFNSAHHMMNYLNKNGVKHSSNVEWIEPKTSFHLLSTTDAVSMVKSLPDSSIQLAVLDPPYNLDIATWDNFCNYIEWAKEWLDELHRVLTDSGNLVIFGGLQYQDVRNGDLLEIMHYLRHYSDLRLVNLIIWNYPNGMGAHRFFSNRHEEIAWYTKTDKYYFDLDAVREKFDPKTLRQYMKDKRLNPESLKKGKNPTNVWRIGRLNGNSKERVGHPTQKPVEVVRRIVRSMSYPGSLVLDFFGGSGVTSRVCIEEKRHSIVSDIDSSLKDYLLKQLEQVDTTNLDFELIYDEHISEFFSKKGAIEQTKMESPLSI